MTRTHTRPSALAARALAALALAAPAIASPLLAARPAHAVIVGGVAARINNDIITLQDVREAAIPFMLQRGLDPQTKRTGTQRAALYRQVLDDLIERRLLVQEAKKQNISISNDELEQWLANVRQQQNMSEDQFRESVEQYGMKFDQYREMTRQNLLRLRIVRFKVVSKIAVSDAEVEAAYRDQFGAARGTQAFYTVRHILIRPPNDSVEADKLARERARDARSRIENGESFGSVAEEVSDGPTAAKQGMLGEFKKGELDPQFEQAAFSLKPGDLSPVVKTKFGYHVIVIDKIDEREDPQVAERRDAIRGELREKAVERQFRVYLNNLRTHSFVDIKV